ncbi:ABC transporter permease [Neobacillus drentensis]|uniref:ABC transporter permease n=1 Tax=Neobacillus drentensis TaxID=220684 RepID=UPI002FFEE679
MNFIKRALLSVKARKGRTFITLIIFMIICNLVLAGFAIRSATEKASELARQKLGSEVTLEPDMDKIIQKLQKDSTGRIHIDPLTEQMAGKLAKLDHVKSYNYISNTFVVADGFKPFKTSNNSQNQDNGTQVASASPPGFTQPDIAMDGVLDGGQLASFKDGTNKIVEGRQITKDDADKQVVVIEKHLAEENNLKVGSKVKVKSVDDKTSGEFEVVGIYETSGSSQQPMGMDMPMMNPYNKMYAPYKASLKVTPKFEDQEPGISQVVYYLDDPKNTEAFKAAAKKQNIDFDTFKLDAKDEAYKKMMGPIENVASFSKTVVYIVAIAGAVILGLIVLLSIKERRYEMGVLLSIGERKGKLIGQFLAEILLIGSFAFALSLFTGNVLSQMVGDSLLQKEIAVSQQQEKEQPMQGTVHVIGPGGPQENINVDAIDHIDVSATANDIRNLGLVGLIIAIFATIIPSLSILRLHPKTILTKTE